MLVRDGVRIFLGAVLILALLSGCSSTTSRVVAGQSAPFARLVMLDGSFKTLEDFRGHNVALIFWRLGCPRSKSVLADLQAFAARHSEPKNIWVVAVNIDKNEDYSTVEEQIRARGLSAMIHSFSGNDIHDEAYMAFDVDSVPLIFAIDKSGRVIERGSSVSVVRDAFKQP